MAHPESRGSARFRDGGSSLNGYGKMAGVMLLILVIVAIAGPASAQRPELRVAYLHDGPAADWGASLRDSLRQEVARVLSADFTVISPPELIATGEATQESCLRELERLLATPGVDLVIASGPIGSLVAAGLPDRPVPVIGSVVLHPEIQGIPMTNGRSGLHNFAYVTAENLLLDDLEALASITDYDSLAVVAPGQFLNAVPADSPKLAAISDAQVYGVIVEGSVAGAVDALPPGTDAVYLLPLVRTDLADIVQFLSECKARKLPVASMKGAVDVERGALVGVTPRDWMRRLHRRVATLALRIVNGSEAGDLPVLLARGGQTYINMRTARAVDISPSFTVMIDAVMIDDFVTADAMTLDIFDAMTGAQRKNQDIESARRAVEAGEHEVSLVASRLLPQIYAGLDGVVIDEDRAIAYPQLSERTFSGSLSLTQVIWSEQTWSDYSIAKDRQDVRRQELMQVALDVGLEAATSYLDMLRAETYLDVQRQNLAFSRTNLERARIRVEVGDANRSEVYRWESKIATEMAAVIDAVAGRESARFALNRVLSRPLEEAFRLEDATLDEQLTVLANPRVDVFTGDPLRLSILRDYLSIKGLSAAPEMLQLDAAISAQQREYKSATRSFWSPTIGLTGQLDKYFSRAGAGSDWSGEGMPDDTDWGMGVFVSLPLFEGGGRFAETKRTTQEVYRLQRRQISVGQRIEERVRGSVFQAASSRLAINLYRDASAAARSNLELVSDNYTLGRASLVDLIDSQTNALNAELAASDAVYAHLLDLMDLERAVGRFTFFAREEARSGWISDLEAFAAEPR